MGQREFQEKYRVAMVGEDEEYEPLMELARQQLPAYLEEALRVDEEDFYTQVVLDVEMSQLVVSQFPDETFAMLLETFKDARFLKSQHGWVLLSVFSSDWDKLSEVQKPVLLSTLTQIYEHCEHWMACFSISELVGEKFPSETAFLFFQKFANSPLETARIFVPHGYEHALKNSIDEGQKATIRAALLRMQSDESAEVRDEVEESLRRLQNHDKRLSHLE